VVPQVRWPREGSHRRHLLAGMPKTPTNKLPEPNPSTQKPTLYIVGKSIF
jgi:hypothetical protein